MTAVPTGLTVTRYGASIQRWWHFRCPRWHGWIASMPEGSDGLPCILCPLCGGEITEYSIIGTVLTPQPNPGDNSSPKSCRTRLSPGTQPLRISRLPGPAGTGPDRRAGPGFPRRRR